MYSAFVRKRSAFVLFLSLFVNTSISFAQDVTAGKNIFLIGNSLTWDTLPGLLEGDVQWHVDCGKNLMYILDNPSNPCVKTSTLWPQALESKQYELLSVQPHLGTTLEEDVATISHWLELQPNAKLVIHTGWNRHTDFETVYHAPVDGQRMVHAPKYFDLLVLRLSEKFPDRSIRTTQAIQVLDEIWHDIAKSQAPFKSFDELYRDNIHLTQVGRYLMHNLMRIALDQSISHQGFQIDSMSKEYLDRKLESIALKQLSANAGRHSQ